MRIIIACTFIMLIAGHALASTHYVPDDFPTIQAAIDSSAVVNGDTVIVRAGTYVENINFLGKAITIRSELGPDFTVIDGKNGVYPNLSVVTFENGEGLDSVIDGFTITNGEGYITFLGDSLGGGIFCFQASPTIKNNIVCHNELQKFTGGWTSGGGIYCNQAALIENNIIHSNSVGGKGSGGGLGCGGSCRIENNIINNNSAGYGGGGGIACSGFAVIEGNMLYGNTDCGISCRDFSTLTNNTLFGNFGPGIRVSQFTAQPEIKNTILWNNNGPEIELAGPGAKPVVTYCDIQGGWPGTGNIDADPLFKNPGLDDFHLTWLSPCINRGINSGGVTLRDIDGDPRPYMGTVEMGADEFGGTHALGADPFSISAATGGYVDLYLFGGAPGGGRNYVVLGTVSGTAPGTPLPGGKVTLPLNWDPFTNIMLGLLNTPVFQNFMGKLSWGSSTSWAHFDTLGPMPGTVGLTVSFAFALHDPWDLVSNPINIGIVP